MQKDRVLYIAIGQKGTHGQAGSGGTFVILENISGSVRPLVIAGGAGADYNKSKNNWCNAQLSEFGNGSNDGDRNADIGGCGISGDPIRFSSNRRNYNGGAGYKKNPRNIIESSDLSTDPKCFDGGLIGGAYEK